METPIRSISDLYWNDREAFDKAWYGTTKDVPLRQEEIPTVEAMARAAFDRHDHESYMMWMGLISDTLRARVAASLVKLGGE